MRWCRAVLDQAKGSEAPPVAHRALCMQGTNSSARWCFPARSGHYHSCLSLCRVCHAHLFRGRVEFNHSVLPAPARCWPGAVLGWVLGPWDPPPPAPSTAVRLCTRRAPSVCTRSWGCCSRPGRCAGKWHSWPLRATGKCEGEVKRHRPSGCHFSLVWCCAAALTALWLLWPCSVLSSKARSRTRASTFDKVQRVLCVTQACI